MSKPKNSLQGHARFSMIEQAEKFIDARANRGKSKASGAILRSDRTVQRYQGDLGRAATAIQKTYGIHRLKDITQQQAQTYIEARLRENIRVRTVQRYAKALEMLPLVKQLNVSSRADDKWDKPQQTRAYTQAQIEVIRQQILSPNADMAIQVLLESGCRAKDLASMCPIAQRPISNARLTKLHPDRFLGREDWIQMSFIGKGGHEYISTISPEKARKIEIFRLPEPQIMPDHRQFKILLLCS